LLVSRLLSKASTELLLFVHQTSGGTAALRRGARQHGSHAAALLFNDWSLQQHLSV